MALDLPGRRTASIAARLKHAPTRYTMSLVVGKSVGHMIRTLKRRWVRASWQRRIARGRVNLDLNRAVPAAATDEALGRALGAAVETLDIPRSAYDAAARHPELRDRHRDGHVHRQILEYTTSLYLLAPASNHVVLDLAGGDTTWLTLVSDTVTPARLILQDPLVTKAVAEASADLIERIGGSAASLPLPDASVDRIACHHSIEHFRGDDDIGAAREIARVLAPGGRAVVLPVFVTPRSMELWNRKPELPLQEPSADLMIDRTSTLPGWGPFEGFARSYDPEALARRLLQPLRDSGCRVHVANATLEGAVVPDLAFNRELPALARPMRLLVVEGEDRSHLGVFSK